VGSRGLNAVAACAGFVLASCGAELRLGQAPTTTTTTTTTSTTAPRPKATKPALARKAKPVARAPARPTTTLPRPAADGAATADDIEPLLVQLDDSWTQLPDEHVGTGPIDLEGAAALYRDEGTRRENLEFFESNGFEAGYSRLWVSGVVLDENGEPYVDNAIWLVVALFKFRAPEGAAALLAFDASIMEEERRIGAGEAFSVKGIPEAHGFAGKDDDGHDMAVVVFTKGSYSVQVAYTIPNDPTGDYRNRASDYARRQYQRLPR
jgi:hypothetical protein